MQRFCNEHYYFADCRILVCGSFGTFLIKKVIEEGYVLAVNKANPVQELSAAQIKDVFDEEITNWKELGGPDAEVKVFPVGGYHLLFLGGRVGSRVRESPPVHRRDRSPVIQAIIAFVPSKFIEKVFSGPPAERRVYFFLTRFLPERNGSLRLLPPLSSDFFL